MKNQNHTPNQTLTQQEILAFLRAHKAQLERDFGVTQIALFGSYARGEQQPDSDIDLLIKAKTHAFRNRLRLKKYLEQALKKRVDINYIDTVRGFIMHHIKEDLVYA